MDRLCSSNTDIKNCCLRVCLTESWIYTLVNDFLKPTQRHCGVILSTVSSCDSPVLAIFDMIFSRTLVSPEHLCFITPWNLRDSKLILWYIWTQRDLSQPLDDHWVNQIWPYQESVFHPSDLYSDGLRVKVKWNISVLNGPLTQWSDLISLGFFFFFFYIPHPEDSSAPPWAGSNLPRPPPTAHHLACTAPDPDSLPYWELAKCCLFGLSLDWKLQHLVVLFIRGLLICLGEAPSESTLAWETPPGALAFDSTAHSITPRIAEHLLFSSNIFPIECTLAACSYEGTSVHFHMLTFKHSNFPELEKLLAKAPCSQVLQCCCKNC